MAGLLERDVELRILAEALEDAAAGLGGAALVFGEAGIGKTSLVRSFLGSARAAARVLVGACDDLVTPRPLGPFHDMARHAPDVLELVQQAGTAEVLYTGLRNLLSDPLRPTTLVIEDVHWADDATLDLLSYLARRIEELRALLVLTYRDDDLREGHRLPTVLGAFATRTARRLPLRRLSPQAVADMSAGLPVRADELFQVTGGNPFFVTEALAAPADEVPATVADAVLARVAALPEPTRVAVELLAVVPGRAERWLVEALLPDRLEVIERAERSAIFDSDVDHVWFRHEIARRALESSLVISRRVQHQRAVLEVLVRHGADPARIMHHAAAVDDAERILAFGPAAARSAALVGAHREAASHYERVLRHAERLSAVEHAFLLTEGAQELLLLHRFDEAVGIAERAVARWREAEDGGGAASALVTLSRASLLALEIDRAYTAAIDAVELLEQMPGVELATAANNLAWVLLMADRYEEATDAAEQAVRIASQLGRDDVLAEALNHLGMVLLARGDAAGLGYLDRAIALARSQRRHDLVALGYLHRCLGLLRTARFGEAEPYLRAGLEYAREHDVLWVAFNLTELHLALLAFRGEWDSAIEGLRDLLRHEPERSGIPTHFTRVLLGRLLVRRGEAEGKQLLEGAWDAVASDRRATFLGPVGTALLEAAWLAGDPDEARAAAELCLSLLRAGGPAYDHGELLRWRVRTGAQGDAFEGCPEPFAAGIAGDWHAAAQAWARLGNPYEQALELAESGRIEPTLEALRILDRLQAEPAARMVRRRLRGMGLRSIPRGPRSDTRAHPAGLTARQAEVLALLAEGLTNAEIADRLVVSVRTVDHHVSAILTKLGVQTRQQAAAVTGPP